MDKIINIGIIGVGIVGERFIKALRKHPRSNVLGIYDVNEERLKHIAQQYNLSTVSHYKELLSNQEIDVIYLAVPPKYHHALALEIMEANKHIICEKPLANSTLEAKEMLEAAEKQKIVHAMNFPTIYTQAFKKLESLLREGFLGELRRIELKAYFPQWPRPWQQTDWISSREQGGFVREVFTHYIQMVQMIFGPIENIDTKIEYPDDPTSCEGGIIATASLSDGTPVLLNGFSDIGQMEDLSLTLFGRKGTLSLVNWRELWVTSREQNKTLVELPEDDHLLDLINEVFNAIDGETSKIIDFNEGYKAQIVVEKLLKNES
ncbi:Gfo/Idh/MocA family protein [Alkaliphilus transvaalensis]|uniref:Gfo/Idh/MocA family protein n=1 Tax=Alkaliphilus transvaalensis TaxID=114628 RepID=UPI00047E54B2|nr:Gfo/Idh/MocA family oxidoreductase [Alkaliphilus transvaalensis]